MNTIELEILKESRNNYDQQWSMKFIQCMRKNKLNLHLDIKTLLLFFRVSFNLVRSAISGSSHLRFQCGKATICILHKATESHGAALELAGGKAGMGDNSESGMLFFVPSNKGILMYQFWLHILYNYRSFVLILLTYNYRSVLLGIQISHCCILQEAHMGYQILFPCIP